MEIELWKQSYDFPNNLFAMDPTIFELWVMEIAKPNTPLVCIWDKFKILAYFYYYSWIILYFLVLFIGLIVLFN